MAQINLIYYKNLNIKFQGNFNTYQIYIEFPQNVYFKVKETNFCTFGCAQMVVPNNPIVYTYFSGLLSEMTRQWNTL